MNVHITESAARDGFQSVKDWIPTETKIILLDALADTGLKRIEAASFVHPKAVPQMADAAEVYTAVKKKYPSDVALTVLVPNLYGAKKALEVGAKELVFVASASKRHNLENTRQTIDQSLEAFREIAAIKGDAVLCFGAVTSFVCPFTGYVQPKDVVSLLARAKEAGADKLTVADTTGTADPKMVKDLLREIFAAFPGLSLGIHLHDTLGMGLANVLAALDMGVTQFDAAASGIGGCPFTPGAAGNIATEDLVGMLHAMGVETGVDLDKLLDAALLIRQRINGCFSSHRAVVAEQKRGIAACN